MTIFGCRLCLGQWSDHGERTGGFYACNRYETAKQEGVVWYSPSVFFPSPFFPPQLFHISLCCYWLTGHPYKFDECCCLQYDESEKRREMAKNSLERYTHYYERWATNQSVCSSLWDCSMILLVFSSDKKLALRTLKSF